MDAKSKVNFINSIENVDSVEASEPVSKEDESTAQDKPAFQPAVNTVAEQQSEEISVFAQGLPSWDVVPPQIIVRRKKK